MKARIYGVEFHVGVYLLSAIVVGLILPFLVTGFVCFTTTDKCLISAGIQFVFHTIVTLPLVVLGFIVDNVRIRLK